MPEKNSGPFGWYMRITFISVAVKAGYYCSFRKRWTFAALSLTEFNGTNISTLDPGHIQIISTVKCTDYCIRCTVIQPIKATTHLFSGTQLTFLALSPLEAFRLKVEPLRSYFRCIGIDVGSKLFMIINRMFFPLH